MKMRKLFAGALLLLLCACGTDLAQQAKVVTTTYTAAGSAVAPVLEQGLVSECVKAEVKVADKLAFGYVEQVNKAGQDWANAPDSDTKSVLEQAFPHIAALANAAIANIGEVLAKPKEC